METKPYMSPFVFRKANPSQATQIENMMGAFEHLYTAIQSIGAPSREKSLAITNLEQAAMWLNKHIAFHCGDEGPDEKA